MPTISDITTEARDLVDADSNSYTDDNLRRRINAAYEQVIGMILGIDGYWQFDDTNYTTHPIGSTTLVATQYDYAFADAHLEVLRVEVKDAGGNWKRLRQIDRYEQDIPLEEKYENDGLPQVYDVQGGSVFIYPAPASGDVTLTNGLRVFFQRTADTYTSTEFSNGTKTPGFASPYHYILSHKAALPYAIKYKPNRVASLEREITKLENGLKEHYARRNYDRKGRLSMGGNVKQAM